MAKHPPSKEDIFNSAAEIDDPSERAKFLDRACQGDPKLRADIEDLLSHDRDAGSFLQAPPVSPSKTVIGSAIDEAAGRVIGPYKLLEQIGVGGMGVVFMADQQAPVRRRVALKIIKPGMDTRQVVARFEAERQALALMDHPNIAKVLDAGATDSGHPFFVMELVRGVPITDYCDQNNLSVQERLELFIPVCQAVQHAHQKGIIHRDIKPSNVLVTLHDGKPVPKVIDFGVAKATNQQLTDKTLFTNFAQMVGTPLYMSPEQAEMSGLDVDTRSDIYSLGVLLYELLTGTTPFDSKRLNKAAIDEIRRIIREEEPPKPSTRLSSMGETRTAVAAHRHVDAGRLHQLICGDLDWIVMKALEKDRTRRYETANGIVRDIQRFLTDQPVEACPPSAAYRFRKFARRNRVAFSTALVISLALIAGTVISTWQAVRARRAEDVARKAEDLAQTRLASEEQAHREAEANLKRARQAVDEYFTTVSQSKLFDVPSLQPLRKDLLEAAVRYYVGFIRERGDDPALLADLSVANLRVAEVYHETDRNDDGIAALESALELVERLRQEYPDAKEEHQRIAGFWKGKRAAKRVSALPKDPAKTERTLKKFVALWEVLAQEYPSVIAFQNDLAAAYSTLGEWQAAAGGAIGSTALAQESVVNSKKAIAIWERLNHDHPEIPEYRESLGRVLSDVAIRLKDAGKPNESATASEQSLELTVKLATEFPKVPQYRVYLVDSLIAQSHRLEADGKMLEAAHANGLRLQIAKGLLDEFPNVTEYFTLVCKSAIDLARIERTIGRTDEAKAVLEDLDRTLEIVNKRIKEHPGSSKYRSEMAESFYALGDTIQTSGQASSMPAIAESALNRCIVLFRQLGIEVPNEPNYRWRIGHAYRILAFVFRELPNRSGDVQQAFEEAEKVFADLSAQFPKNESYAHFMTDTSFQLDDFLEATGRKKEALEALQKSLERRERYCIEFPDSEPGRFQLGHLLWRVGSVAEQAGQLAEAEKLQRRALAVYEKLGTDFPDHRQYRFEQGFSDWNIAGLMRRHGRLSDAEVAHRQAVDVYAKLSSEVPNDASYRDRLARSHYDLAGCLREAKRMDESEKHFRQSVTIWEQLAADVPGEPIFLVHAAFACANDLGPLVRSQNRDKDAEEAYRRAIALTKKLLAAETARADRRHFIGVSYDNLAEILGTHNKHADAETLNRDALAVWEKLVTESPGNVDFRYHLGQTLRRRGDILAALKRPQDAEQAYQKSLDVFRALAMDHRRDRNLQGEYLFSTWKLGWFLKDSDRLQESLEHLHRALDMSAKIAADFPKDGEAQAARSRSFFEIIEVLIRQANHAGAAKLAVEVARVFPEKWEESQRAVACLERCVELAKKDGTLSPADRKAAIEQYSNKSAALMTDAGKRGIANPLSVNNFAWKLATRPEIDLRSPGVAVELARKMVEMTPTMGHCWNTLGVAQYRAGDWNAADVALHKSMKLRAGGDSFDWFFLAMCDWQRGNKDTAGKWYKAACLWMAKNAPKNEELARFRSEAAGLLKMPASTPDNRIDDLDVAQGLVDANPSGPTSYQYRGQFYAHLGQWDKAADDFAKAVELGPDDVENAWYPLALLQLQAGRTEDYQRLCTRLLARFSQSDAPGLPRMVALICKLGPQAAANQTPSVQLAEKALLQNPKNGELVGILGECLYRKGDFAAAVQRLEESVRPDAGIGLHWRQLFLAMAHRRLGHTAQAEAYLKQASDWIQKNAQEKLEIGAELSSPLPWTIRLDVQLLRQEAQALFGQDRTRQLSHESAKALKRR